MSSGSTAWHVDFRPLVKRTLQFLERCPRGASRDDILSAMNLQPSVWLALRTALRHTGMIRVKGRGPGLRHIHIAYMTEMELAHSSAEDERLRTARNALQGLLETQGIIDSSDAQRVTGFRADPARKLLLEFVHQGKVERSGNKRATKYRWLGDTAS